MLVIAPARAAEQAGLSIDPRFHHLGAAARTPWPEAPGPGEGRRLEIEFRAAASAGPKTLAITQRNVLGRSTIYLNGIALAELRRAAERTVAYYPVRPGILKDGANSLVILETDFTNEMVLGELRLLDEPLEQVLSLRPVEVRVREARTGRPLPARVTVAGPRGEPVEIYHPGALAMAVRKGVVYVPPEGATLLLPEGDYALAATRGMEWSLARKALHVGGDGLPGVALELAHEVDTSGFLACDTHVHTYTFSGHGDATIDERLLTLAAEGVELAIATDHNHVTDYGPAREGFAATPGDEVTTSNGHFNAFPLSPAAPPPAWGESDWVKLVAGMRRKGAEVVILNHPRWPAPATGPFGRFGLDRLSGERAAGGDFTFDAVEVANSTTLLPDPLFSLEDWFALLNHGEKLAAVGASDSHTVGDPVGQARSYVPSATKDPARIDLAAVAGAFRAGTGSVSLGIFADARVGGRTGMGGLAAVERGEVEVELHVAAPSWVRPERARVFVDGAAVADEPIAPHEGPLDARLRFRVRAPRHDAWLVCAVTGAATGAAWPAPYTLAATNPIFLDGDGDGRYTSPRASAAAILAREGRDPARLLAALDGADDAVAVQLASLARRELPAEALDRLAAGRAAIKVYLKK